MLKKKKETNDFNNEYIINIGDILLLRRRGRVISFIPETKEGVENKFTCFFPEGVGRYVYMADYKICRTKNNNLNIFLGLHILTIIP